MPPSLRLAALSLAGAALLACPVPRNADVNRDGGVDILDVSLVSSCLGADLAALPQCIAADTDQSGAVTQADLDFVVARYRVPTFPALVSSDPASGATAVPRTAWPRLEFAAEVPLRALATIELHCAETPIALVAHRIEPRLVAVNPSVDLPASSECEIGWPGPDGPVAQTFHTAALGAPAEVHYDRSDPAYAPPFPDDYWLVEDPTTATGLRVAVDVPARESDVANLFQSLITDTALLDGFSPLAMIAVELSQPPQQGSLPMSVEASLDPLASIGLFDLTPGSPTLGQRVPFQLHVRSDSVAGQPLATTLVAFPSIPLEPGGRYGFVVTRRALASASSPFDASSFFQAVAGAESSGEDPAVTHARSVADDVLETLVANAYPPIPREDVALALRISVRSTDDLPRDLLAMRAQVAARPAPTVTVDEVLQRSGAAAAEIFGTWQAPNWRQGLFLARDASGAPRITRTDEADFVLALPQQAHEGPVPVTLYQHGNPGSAYEVVSGYQDDLLEAGFAVIGATDPLNRYYPGGAYAQLTGIFGTLLFGRRLPDFWVQTFGEQIAFLRALESLAAMDFLPVGAPDGVPELDLSQPLTYRGVSNGSNNGQAFLAYAPEVKAAALLTGAQRFAEILFHQDTTDPTGIGSFLDFIAQQVPNVRAPEVWVGFSLFQMLFDRQDPHNHARFLYREPLEVDGTTRKSSILVVEGLRDSFIPANATRSLAWQLGPVPHLAPVLEPVPYLEAADGPVVANVDAETTAAFVQYRPAGLGSGLPPSPGCEYWDEGHYCGQLASSRQQVEFFLSALGDGAPTILSIENDTDGDGLADFLEDAYGTDPLDPDSDGDGFLDGDEVAVGLNPAIPDDPDADADGDGLTTAQEVELGTRPFTRDSDGDGLWDGDEVARGTSPVRSDTDGGGRRDGDEVMVDGTDPLDPADDRPVLPLPVTLFDGGGFRWDFDGLVRVADGTNDAFDGGFELRVNGTRFSFVLEVLVEENGREIVFGPAQIGTLRVTRKAYVPADAGFARFLEIVENQGTAPATARLRIATNLGSDALTQIVATSSGDALVTTADDYLVTDDADGAGSPAVAHVFGGPNGAIDPVSAFSNAPFDSVYFEYDVPLAPGERAIVMHFGVQAATRAEATDLAAALRVLSGRALAGMSNAERRAVVNVLAIADADGDGLPDEEEGPIGTDPNDPDTDGDGLLDGFEVDYAFDPLTPGEQDGDADGDGLDELAEQELGTNPRDPDSDEDGLFDGEEVLGGTDPLRADTDGDLLSDSAERSLGTDPLNPDTDSDGLGDFEEVDYYGTDPLLPDTDGDGLRDDVELSVGLSPTNPDDAALDWDGDGLANAEEIAYGTYLYLADSDYDDLADGDEIALGTNPLQWDTDGGGRADGREVLQDGTDPLDPSDDRATAYLPYYLFDGAGYLWDVFGGGTINNGTFDAFDGGLALTVDGAYPPFPYEAALEDEARTLVLAPVGVAGARVSREIYVPHDAGFARYLDSVENPSAAPITVTLRITSNLGSDSWTELVTTSSGDALFDVTDDYVVTDDVDASGDPTIAHVLSDSGGALQPWSAYASAGDDTVRFEFRILLAPGETRSILHFAVQAPDRAAAIATAESLVRLEGPALQALDAAELAAIANFAIAP